MCAKESGECIRPSVNGLQSYPVAARRMTPVAGHVVSDNAAFPMLFRTIVTGQVVRTGWCSECSPNGYCCPNASGQHNRMCCDKAGVSVPNYFS